MDSRVVCLSFADGAFGREVGQLVAGELGYRLIDEGIVWRAAQEAGLDRHTVADAERRKSLVARLLEGAAASGAAAGPAFGLPPPLDDASPEGDDLRGLIRTAIEETAAEGNCVIVAHAASLALAGREEVLRVLVTASPETRCARLAEERGLDERAAAKALRESDAGRAAYLKRFYGVRAELPTAYDLVLNTDRLDPKSAAALVVQAAGRQNGVKRQP
jgi:cytidylate kinase